MDRMEPGFANCALKLIHVFVSILLTASSEIAIVAQAVPMVFFEYQTGMLNMMRGGVRCNLICSHASILLPLLCSDSRRAIPGIIIFRYKRDRKNLSKYAYPLFSIMHLRLLHFCCFQ